MKYSILLILLCGVVNAHEMTPTYPKLTRTYVDNIYETELTIFNARKDVNYYELSVWDKDWNSIPFATQSRVLNIEYTKRKKFKIYIRKKDIDRVVYVCSLSKLISDKEQKTSISSKICSKIK
jgi:hypothetical protein